MRNYDDGTKMFPIGVEVGALGASEGEVDEGSDETDTCLRVCFEAKGRARGLATNERHDALCRRSSNAIVRV